MKLLNIVDDQEEFESGRWFSKLTSSVVAVRSKAVASLTVKNTQEVTLALSPFLGMQRSVLVFEVFWKRGYNGSYVSMSNFFKEKGDV